MSEMPKDEFSAYVDILFLRRLCCSLCGTEFSPDNRPEQDDAEWAGAMARDALARGWRLNESDGSKAICPNCTTGASTLDNR
jgi:hypothetical protein